jgi:hypothetical protein
VELSTPDKALPGLTPNSYADEGPAETSCTIKLTCNISVFNNYTIFLFMPTPCHFLDSFEVMDFVIFGYM